MNEINPVPVDVRWFTPEEGGRRTGLPHGTTYAATGRFETQPTDDMFSVVLHFTNPPDRDRQPTPATVSPGFPENVPDFASRLARGDQLIVHEGARAVARCVAAVPVPTTSGS